MLDYLRLYEKENETEANQMIENEGEMKESNTPIEKKEKKNTKRYEWASNPHMGKISSTIIS